MISTLVEEGGSLVGTEASETVATRNQQQQFQFEALSAPINWPRIMATNVAHVERLHDYSTVMSFLADVTVGDADDGFVEYDTKSHLIALRYLQLSIQYLLHSQQILSSRKRAFDTGIRRLKKREEAERRRLEKRRSEIKILNDETEHQDDVLSTYQTILEAVDPALAMRVAQDKDGRIVLAPEEEDDEDEFPSSFHDLDVAHDTCSIKSDTSLDDEPAQPRPEHPMRTLRLPTQ